MKRILFVLSMVGYVMFYYVAVNILSVFATNELIAIVVIYLFTSCIILMYPYGMLISRILDERF